MGRRKYNPKSILFLHEGYTERDFYNKVFDVYLPKRKIRIHKHNLKGIYNLNKKVKAKISGILEDRSHKEEKEFHVFVALDREGKREEESPLDLEGVRKEFIRKKSRIKSINEIVATQDLESWFFHDIDGIYNFLKVPVNQRVLKVHNVEKFNNRNLQQLFRKHGQTYQKRGKNVEGFIEELNLEKIYSNAFDLQKGIERMLLLFD